MKRLLIYGLSSIWGGRETIVMNTVIHLQRHFTIDIVKDCNCYNYEERFVSENIRFVEIPAWGRNVSAFKRQFSELLMTNNYDYVWINASAFANKTVFTTIKRFSTAQIIAHSHGSSVEASNCIKLWIIKLLHYLNRSSCAKLINYPCCCSYQSADWFYGKNYRRTHEMFLFKNGVDFDLFRYNIQTRLSVREEFGWKDEFVLFHAGRLSMVKNQFFLVDIVRQLIDDGVNACLCIAGDGELKDPLKYYINEKNVSDRVLLLGLRTDLNRLYQAADIFLLPSFHEGFPVTIVEAQASGLSCIVSSNLSREIKLNDNLFFCGISKKNINEWTTIIKDLKNNPTDRIRISTAFPQTGFTIEQVAKDFLTFIDKSR